MCRAVGGHQGVDLVREQTQLTERAGSLHPEREIGCFGVGIAFLFVRPSVKDENDKGHHICIWPMAILYFLGTVADGEYGEYHGEY